MNGTQMTQIVMIYASWGRWWSFWYRVLGTGYRVLPTLPAAAEWNADHADRYDLRGSEVWTV